VLDLVAPQLCPLCGRKLRGLPPGHVASHGGAALRSIAVLGGEPVLLLSGGLLEGDYRRLVHAFKFSADFAAGALLSEAMVATLPAAGLWDAVVAVPAHRARERERGWVPAEWLAAEVAKATDRPLRKFLRRIRYEGAATGAGAALRRRLVAGAFESRNAWGRLLLVDDVWTTLATFRECRRALLAAGALSVDLLTAAHRPRTWKKLQYG